MSDPDFVKLAAGITVLSDPTTAWGLSQNSVATWGYNDGWFQWGEVDPP